MSGEKPAGVVLVCKAPADPAKKMAWAGALFPQADPRRARAIVADFQKAVRRRLLWRRVKRAFRRGPWIRSR